MVPWRFPRDLSLRFSYLLTLIRPGFKLQYLYHLKEISGAHQLINHGVTYLPRSVLAKKFAIIPGLRRSSCTYNSVQTSTSLSQLLNSRS